MDPKHCIIKGLPCTIILWAGFINLISCHGKIWKKTTPEILLVCLQINMSHDTTKPTKWVCAQRRLRSAWASAQSDQSLRCLPWRKLRSLATHWAYSEDSDQTGRMPRLIWVFAGRTVILLVLSCHSSYFEVLFLSHLPKTRFQIC